MQPTSKSRELPGEWTLTYATDVQDRAISIKDASLPIVEALGNGKPVSVKDVEVIKHEIDLCGGELDELKKAMEQLSR